MITIPVIPKSQWQWLRCVLFCALTAVYCILASVLLRVPPLEFTSLPISLPPTLLPFSAPSLPPSSARFILHLFPSLRPCLHSFHSFPSSTFPPFLHSRSHPPSHHSFLAPSRCFLPLLSPCSLPPPSDSPSCLAPSVPPSLPVSGLLEREPLRFFSYNIDLLQPSHCQYYVTINYQCYNFYLYLCVTSHHLCNNSPFVLPGWRTRLL